MNVYEGLKLDKEQRKWGYVPQNILLYKQHKEDLVKSSQWPQEKIRKSVKVTSFRRNFEKHRARSSLKNTSGGWQHTEDLKHPIMIYSLVLCVQRFKTLNFLMIFDDVKNDLLQIDEPLLIFTCEKLCLYRILFVMTWSCYWSLAGYHDQLQNVPPAQSQFF